MIRDDNITAPIANPIKDNLVPLWTNFNANGFVRWHTSVYLNLFHWPMRKDSGNPNGVCGYVRAMYFRVFANFEIIVAQKTSPTVDSKLKVLISTV